jgi:hypothetical protein
MNSEQIAILVELVQKMTLRGYTMVNSNLWEEAAEYLEMHPNFPYRYTINDYINDTIDNFPDMLRKL